MAEWRVSYYSDEVTKAIKEWPINMKARFLRMVNLIEEHGAHLGPPHTEHLGKNLFEIRIKASEGIGRAFFCYVLKQEIIILYAFIKKTQKIPKKILKLVRKRMEEIET